MKERLLHVAQRRYIDRGLPIPLDLWARLTDLGVMVAYL